MAVTTEQITALGLAGVPRAAPLFLENAGTVERPSGLELTELSLAGVPGVAHSFDPKELGTAPPRPSDSFTDLGLAGVPVAVRGEFLPKSALRGIAGGTTVSLVPSATITIGRRYSVSPDVVVTIRPVSATITVAHRISVVGRTTVSFEVRAGQLRYTRHGKQNQINGFNQFALTPFGFARHHRAKRLSGSASFSVTPRAKLKYTPAPVRNHHLAASVRLTLRPQGSVTYTPYSYEYAISGSSTISLVPQGTVHVTRQATYSQHGSVTFSLVPSGKITYVTGAPQAYSIHGSTTIQFVVRASRMGLVIGENKQYAVEGSSVFRVVPNGRIEYRRPAPLSSRVGRRSFIRVFR